MEANDLMRRRLGLALIVAGLVPWIGLTFYIVQVRQPSALVIVAYLLCWATFFVGKTLIKTREPRVDTSDPGTR